MNGSKIFQRITAITSIVALSAVMLSGCGTNTKGNTKATATPQKAAEPTQISIMTQYYTKTAPAEDNPVILELQKRTNTKLQISWTPATNYPDKFSVLMASGELSDLTLVLDPHSEAMRKYISQGAFWNLTDIYKQYKSVAGIPDFSWNNTKAADGKSYYIPRPRPVDGSNVFALREDLVTAAGLKLPTTTDELYNVLKAVTKANPGNVGLAAAASTNGLNISGELQPLLNTFTKAFDNFKVVNGELVFVDTLPEMKTGISYIKKLFDEKLVNQDFAVLKDFKPLVNSGNMTAVLCGAASGGWTYQKEIVKALPNAKMTIVPYLNDHVQKGSGYFGAYVINKKIPETKMKKVMEFMDYCYSGEGGILLNMGIEGIHYTKENGSYKPNTQAVEKDVISGDSFGQIAMIFDKYARAGTSVTDMPKEMLDYNKKVIDQIEKVKTFATNPLEMGIVSDTASKTWIDYQKKSTEIKLKIILGKDPLTSWDKYVEELKADANLSKMMKEYTESYKGKGGK